MALCGIYARYKTSLPNHVVLSDTVNMFKSRLDKFWQHQDMLFMILKPKFMESEVGVVIRYISISIINCILEYKMRA